MSEATLGDILHSATNGRIEQVSRLPRSVETTARNIEAHFKNTATLLVNTAISLEERALKLREKADILQQQSSLAEEIRSTVRFEQECFDEVKSLALIDVGIRPEQG